MTQRVSAVPRFRDIVVATAQPPRMAGHNAARRQLVGLADLAAAATLCPPRCLCSALCLISHAEAASPMLAEPWRAATKRDRPWAHFERCGGAVLELRERIMADSPDKR